MQTFTHLQARNRSTKPMAMAGSMRFDCDSRLMNMAVHLGGIDHVLGHSDITGHALARPTDLPFGADAATLLSQAS